jgi:hypothetical protein
MSGQRRLTRLVTKEGFAVFDKSEAQSILERLGASAVKFTLERVALFDLPKLQVTNPVGNGKGGVRIVSREFSKLSLDNSSRSYSTLVPVLRRAKERRQVIIVTHNPNVAVLGDAEQIIVMKAHNDRCEIVTRGSIDNPETRHSACAILEGAMEAFTRRAKMYGNIYAARGLTAFERGRLGQGPIVSLRMGMRFVNNTRAIRGPCMGHRLPRTCQVNIGLIQSTGRFSPSCHADESEAR